jgi:glucan biosynthesis protein
VVQSGVIKSVKKILNKSCWVQVAEQWGANANSLTDITATYDMLDIPLNCVLIFLKPNQRLFVTAELQII